MKHRMEKTLAALRARTGTASYSWWSSNAATTALIAQMVSNMIHAPLVDETKLEGKYAVRLDVPGPETPDESLECPCRGRWRRSG